MNTKKILGILICMLVLTTIPVAAGTTINQDPEPSKIGWTTLQGFIWGLREVNGGAMLTFRCFFVHYVSQGLGSRETGFIWNSEVMTIDGSFRGVLMPHMIMGIAPGAYHK